MPRLSKNGLIKFDRFLLQQNNGNGKCQRRDRYKAETLTLHDDDDEEEERFSDA